LRDTVRRFLVEKASLPTYGRPMLDDSTGTTDEVWGGLAALGATGVLVPQEYGGSGMTMVEAAAHVALPDHRRRDDPDQQERHRGAGPRIAAPMNLELTGRRHRSRSALRCTAGSPPVPRIHKRA
jgi:hypothetical protein